MFHVDSLTKLVHILHLWSLCPGSDVNSMDSGDSGCTMGAGDSQSNHTAPASSEMVIWEIEVPKASGHRSVKVTQLRPPRTGTWQ